MAKNEQLLPLSQNTSLPCTCIQDSPAAEQAAIVQRPDYLVCTCMEVMYSEIVAAIRRGNTTFEGLSAELMVGTGCSSCIQEVEQIIREEMR